MAGRTKQHRRHNAAGAVLNALQQAIRSAARIRPDELAVMLTAMRSALDGFLRAGPDAGEHWRSLADTANVAEQLAQLGIGSGPEAEQVIHDAQVALAYAAQERQDRGTWALRADERDELRERLTWLVSVHTTQIAACSYGEFERAYQRTVDRVRQARAGNAPREAVVVEGAVA